MPPIISIATWVSLPTEVRYRIRALFKIPRSSNTVVNDGRIETDGTTHEDFKHLTIEKMQDYLNVVHSDFHKLFDGVVARVSDELQKPKVLSAVIVPGQIIQMSDDAPITIITEPKKRKYAKKK